MSLPVRGEFSPPSNTRFLGPAFIFVTGIGLNVVACVSALNLRKKFDICCFKAMAFYKEKTEVSFVVKYRQHTGVQFMSNQCRGSTGKNLFLPDVRFKPN